MTPAARVQAAIEVLDRIGAGAPAEQALTNWARGARYAGSGDRAAVRDHVFDAVRQWRSTACLGGDATGRGRMIGLLRAQGADLDAVFNGAAYAPGPLDEAERRAGTSPAGDAAWDLPDWLAERFRAGLGPQAEPTALALRKRAAVDLRVNIARTTRESARALLDADGIAAEPHPLSGTALRVTAGARGVARSRAYLDGVVELQDAASQAVVDALPLRPGMRVLDYCAGGGGKALAMAARLHGPVEAHDADQARMADLPARAWRAGADIRPVAAARGLYDLVLCDVPCSGSGAWRRAPDGKWRLTPDRLAELQRVQDGILDRASRLVTSEGVLAYATCSVLAEENRDRVAAFLARSPDWQAISARQFLPAEGGDGFYVACLSRYTGVSTT